MIRLESIGAVTQKCFGATGNAEPLVSDDCPG